MQVFLEPDEPKVLPVPYWTDGEFPTAEQIRERLAAQPAALPTETEWKYSNLGLTLAGEIVTAVSGRPYAECVADHVLQPLENGARRRRVPGEGENDRQVAVGRRLIGEHADFVLERPRGARRVPS